VVEDGGAEIGPIMARLSRYIAGAPDRPLPEAVAEKGKHHLLDTVAAMVSGATLKPGRFALAYVRGQGGVEEASVPGSDVVTSAVNAALAGGMLAHADETDDSHEPSFSHPGCAVVPAALALGERQGVGGEALLRAVVLGYDVGARSTLALRPRDFYARGFSSHSFAGAFGATAAGLALIGADERAVRFGLSYAAQQASGIGTWARDDEHIEKAFDFGGMPARNAAATATMIDAGFTGVADVFTGARNFLQAYGGDDPDPEALARGLGEDFEVMRANIKKWSVGSPIQAALDSLEALVVEHGFGADEVERIVVRLPDREAHIVDGRTMPDVNCQHLLAVLLVRGGLDFKSSHDHDLMTAADVVAVRARIELVADADLGAATPRRQAIVEVTLRDGRTVDHRTRQVRGTADNPMTRAEVAAKARDLLTDVIGSERAERLIGSVWAIEDIDDVRALRPLWRA